MESDSGISVNLSHFDPELSNRRRQDPGVTVAQIINGKLLVGVHSDELDTYKLYYRKSHSTKAACTSPTPSPCRTILSYQGAV